MKYNNYSNYRKVNKKNNFKSSMENMGLLKNTINSKVRKRISENKLKYVRINYFNTDDLRNRTSVNYIDTIKHDDENNIDYLEVVVYFSNDTVDLEQANMLLNMTSDDHKWIYSKDDEIYIDGKGRYIDKLELNKYEGDDSE